jgi:hypothetical protein
MGMRAVHQALRVGGQERDLLHADARLRVHDASELRALDQRAHPAKDPVGHGALDLEQRHLVAALHGTSLRMNHALVTTRYPSAKPTSTLFALHRFRGRRWSATTSALASKRQGWRNRAGRYFRTRQ